MSEERDPAVTLLAPHPILAGLLPRRGSRIEAAAGSGRMRWRARDEARILAIYERTREPAVILSAGERVLLIGPRLGASQRRKLFRALFRRWELIPLRVRGEGIRAHLGQGGLSVANESGQASSFEVILPFEAVLLDHDAYEIEEGRTVLTGRLEPGRAIFTRWRRVKR